MSCRRGRHFSASWLNWCNTACPRSAPEFTKWHFGIPETRTPVHLATKSNTSQFTVWKLKWQLEVRPWHYVVYCMYLAHRQKLCCFTVINQTSRHTSGIICKSESRPPARFLDLMRGSATLCRGHTPCRGQIPRASDIVIVPSYELTVAADVRPSRDRYLRCM